MHCCPALRTVLCSLLIPVAVLSAAPSPKPSSRKEPALRLEVAAGSIDRSGSVASVSLPAGARQAAWIRSDDGKTLALQVDSDGRGWFIVDALKAGATQGYTVDLRRKPSRKADTCDAIFEGADVMLTAFGRPVVQYNQLPTRPPRERVADIYKRGGYLHPVFTPSGMVVTDDYSTNHLHHHGIWTAWTSTAFEGRRPDFWNMGQGKGTVLPVKLEDSWSGEVQSGFRATHRHVDLLAKPRRIALDEMWEVRLYAVGNGKPAYRVFDLSLRQVGHGPEPLVLLEHHYGGLGVRGHEQWNGAAGTRFLTSEGVSDRVKAHATRARWCSMSGTVDGREGGMAILCHPSSFRAPQPMRIHPTEPFFCYAPPQAGEFSISEKQPYEAHYRFVSFDGAPDAALLERLWQDFANPVSVTVGMR